MLPSPIILCGKLVFMSLARIFGDEAWLIAEENVLCANTLLLLFVKLVMLHYVYWRMKHLSMKCHVFMIIITDCNNNIYILFESVGVFYYIIILDIFLSVTTLIIRMLYIMWCNLNFIFLIIQTIKIKVYLWLVL